MKLTAKMPRNVSISKNKLKLQDSLTSAKI